MNDPGKIRNIALVGHRGTGKTSLFEALLYSAGALTRLGSVGDGTTFSDWDDAQRSDGVADELGLGRILFCNMLDRERADFANDVKSLRETFGAQVAAVQLPIGKEHDLKGIVDLLGMKAYTYEGGKAKAGDIPAELADEAAAARDKLIDAIASTNDELAEKYLMEEEISPAELNSAFAAAVASAQLFPVACGSATGAVGVDRLFEVLALAPSPSVAPPRVLVDADGNETAVDCDPGKPAVAFVFKTLADPFSGHVNVFRVFQGTVTSDSQFSVSRDGHKERFGQLLKTMGKENKPAETLVAGDIGAIAKLKDVVTGDTLHADGVTGAFPAIAFPVSYTHLTLPTKA